MYRPTKTAIALSLAQKRSKPYYLQHIIRSSVHYSLNCAKDNLTAVIYRSFAHWAQPQTLTANAKTTQTAERHYEVAESALSVCYTRCKLAAVMERLSSIYNKTQDALNGRRKMPSDPHSAQRPGKLTLPPCPTTGPSRVLQTIYSERLSLVDISRHIYSASLAVARSADIDAIRKSGLWR